MMSSYNNIIRMQKSKSILRYRSIILKTLAIFFRFMDAFIFLTIIISTFSVNSFSGHQLHFRGASFTNYSPIFAFVAGNAIILLLIFKSRMLRENGDGGDDNNGGIEFYNEHFKSLIDSDTSRSMDASNRGYNKICRSRSEDLMRVRGGGEDEVTHRKSRRSVTETRRLDRRWCDGYAAEDEMSGEEFQRTVEAFIARQQKSLREEEFSPIV